MINHHHQDVLFRGNSALPLNPAALNSLFAPRFRHVDIASLVPMLLSRFGSGSYSRVVSTLVNVCSPFSGFSCGYAVPPPDGAYPQGAHLLFTFALRLNVKWDDPIWTATPSIRSNVWGSTKYNSRFLTVSLNSTECEALGLLNIQFNEALYLYRIIGIIFRSIFMHYSPREIDNLKNGQDVEVIQGPYELRDQYLRSPVSAIVRYPYWAWKFNQHVWERAPNLIPYTHIAPELVLYYFMFISGTLDLDRPGFDGQQRVLGLVPGKSDGVARVMIQSLLAFSQRIRDVTAEFSLEELLAPNVLSSLIYLGKSVIRVRRDTFKQDLIDNAVSISEQLHQEFTMDDLSTMFSPYAKTVREILESDAGLANRLLKTFEVRS